MRKMSYLTQDCQVIPKFNSYNDSAFNYSVSCIPVVAGRYNLVE